MPFLVSTFNFNRNFLNEKVTHPLRWGLPWFEEIDLGSAWIGLHYLNVDIYGPQNTCVICMHKWDVATSLYKHVKLAAHFKEKSCHMSNEFFLVMKTFFWAIFLELWRQVILDNAGWKTCWQELMTTIILLLFSVFFHLNLNVTLFQFNHNNKN